MKYQVYPEDMFFDYVTTLLHRTNYNSPYKKCIDLFPNILRYSEEFFSKWQALSDGATKAFLGQLFGNRHFLVPQNNKIVRLTLYDADIWQDLEFKFSNRAADRLYEIMLSNHKEGFELGEYDHLLATSADALFISLCINNFHFYNFTWLTKNKANWLIKACFIESVCQITNEFTHGFAGCTYLLEQPETCEFPLRELLIEKFADYLKFTLEQLSISPTHYDKIGNETTQLYDLYKNAMQIWIEKAPIGFEDEIYLQGASKLYKIEELYLQIKNEITRINEETIAKSKLVNEILE